jgi:anti-anti-sigma factor
MVYKIDDSREIIFIELSSIEETTDFFNLKNTIIEKLDESKYDVVVDLKNVNYVDSMCLGVLISIQKKVLEYGGSFVIKTLSADLKKLLQANKVKNILEI